MNTIEVLYTRLATLAGLVLVLFLLYKLIRLLVSRAGTYIRRQDGKFRQEGLIKYNLLKDNFSASDLTRDFADQLIGEISVREDGKAWVQVRRDNDEHPDSGFVKLGYIDLTGSIYDKDHCHIGYVGNTPGMPDMNGKRKWYELFLRCHANVYLCARQEQILNNAGEPGSGDNTSNVPQDQCVGKCIETGRFTSRNPDNYTALGRAAAFLLLYQRNRQVRPKSENLSVTRYDWWDTALISAFVFSVLYAIFYLFNFGLISMPFLGDWGFVLAATALYPIVWALARQIKIEQSLNGKPVEHFLMLFNRNTGLSGMNNFILLFGLGAFFMSFFVYGRDFIPLQIAILVGVFINGKYVIKSNWIVYDKFRLPALDEVLAEDEETAGMLAREYHWELDSDDAELQGDLELYFTQEEIDELRNRNPFKTEASLGFDRNIELLFKERVDVRHLKRINHYVASQSYEKGLSGLETMQFILDFVQEPNIKYLADEESAETGGVEYARFPVETLFDKHGDCDCKAVLAAALFRNAGYKVAYVTSASHAAIAVACPKEWFRYYDTNKLYAGDKKALIDKEGLYYYFCETTGDAFRVGDYGEGTNPEEFKNFRFLK